MKAGAAMFRPLIVLSALLLAVPAVAQPTADFDATLAEAKAKMLADPAGARSEAEAAQRIAERSAATPARNLRIASAEWLQAEASVRMDDAGRAAPLIERALRRLGNTAPSKLRGDLMMSRGGVHVASADIGAALADYHAAYDIFRRAGETRNQAIALLMIAGIYQEAGDFNAALRYQGQALDVYAGDPALSVSIYNNRAGILKDQAQYAKAQDQYERALAGARSMDSTELEARILRNLARVAVARGDLPLAQQRLDQARLLSPKEQRQSDATAAEIALRRQQNDRARSLIDAAFAGLDLTRTELPMREAHYTAYAVYRTVGDAAKALAHLQAMKRLDDQVWKLTASTNTALMAARFDSANQEARIAKLKADEAARRLELAQSEARFQRIIFAGVTLSALVVLGLLGVGLWQSRRARVRLSASNIALEKALAAKTEFLATTSHEIRTPLNGILGMTQVMLADPRLDAASRDRVGIVHDAGLTMRGLVDDILDVAKMEAGNLVVEARPFDLRAMLEDVTRMWAEQARAKGLDFRLEVDACPRGLIGDAGRVRQVVYNLLSNAVKFTAEGTVTVIVACEGNRLKLTVADSGIGIPSDKHDEIFESFKQADGGTTRQFGGTGLGLAIVRNIVVALDGTITVESVPDQGATFVIDLPYVPADVPAPAAGASEPGGLLVVDRNPIARAMLKAVLEPRAGRVAFANDCADAAAILEKEDFALVLIDEATARLDDADPVETIAPLARRARVAVLWVAPDESVHRALVGVGVDQVIAKPLAGPALASALYSCNTDRPVVTQAA